jgi:hypothetical protein
MLKSANHDKEIVNSVYRQSHRSGSLDAWFYCCGIIHHIHCKNQQIHSIKYTTMQIIKYSSSQVSKSCMFLPRVPMCGSVLQQTNAIPTCQLRFWSLMMVSIKYYNSRPKVVILAMCSLHTAHSIKALSISSPTQINLAHIEVNH